MTKRGKTHRTETDALALHVIQPWSCIHLPDQSQIEAYGKKSGRREIIAETWTTENHSAKAMAEFIATSINNAEKREDLIEHMTAALELCLECKLNWSAEHDAELVLRRARNRV